VSLYIRNNKYVVIVEGIKSVLIDRVLHANEWHDIIQINYLDNSVIQMPYDDLESCKQGFESIARYLTHENSDSHDISNTPQNVQEKPQ